MTLLATLVGLAIAGIGVACVISPDWVLSLADWRTRQMMWSSAVARVLLGVVFVRVAPDTSVPLAFQMFGVLVVVAGVITVFMPFSTWQGLIDSVLGQPTAFFRSMGVFATLFGLALAYLV